MGYWSNSTTYLHFVFSEVEICINGVDNGVSFLFFVLFIFSLSHAIYNILQLPYILQADTEDLFSRTAFCWSSTFFETSQWRIEDSITGYCYREYMNTTYTETRFPKIKIQKGNVYSKILLTGAIKSIFILKVVFQLKIYLI